LTDDEACGVSEEWFNEYKQAYLAACEDHHPHLLDVDILQEKLDSAFEVPEGKQRMVLTSPEDHLSGKHLLYFVTYFVDKKLGCQLLELSVLNRYLKLLKHVPVAGFERIVKKCWDSLSPQIERFGARFQVPEKYRNRPENAGAAAA
jgi:hypothetical protein